MGISGYILEKYNKMTNAYTCNRLVSEAKELGMELDIIGIHDTVIREDGIFNASRKLKKRDFLFNRYKWGKLKEDINKIAIRSYNPISAYDIYINKYEQVRNLKSEAFLVPKYALASAQFKYEELSDYLGQPFVAKGLESSQGTEIILVKNYKDYQQLGKMYGYEKEWLFEEFINTSVGRDIRFYSIRGNVEACMIRTSQGDFRANVALGADVEAHAITPAMRQIAKDIYNQTGLDFLGIDLMFGEDKPYFCEINVMPGIEGIERATGINVAKRIMETIKGDFENDTE